MNANQLYRRLLDGIPLRIRKEDNVRVYKRNSSDEVMCWGSENNVANEEIGII